MENADQLLTLVEEAVSPFHTIEAVKRQLFEAGYEEITLKEEWELKRGHRYCLTHHGSCLFAFTIGKEFQKSDGFRIGAAHGDFPGFRIKPNPEVVTEGYVRLNTETYGGVNLASWMDRPLSVAGRVILKSEEPFQPEVRLIDVKKPILTIPNIAIHLEREMNKGMELNKQTHMLPILGLIEKELKGQGFFAEFLAKELKVVPEDILDYELNLYNTDTGDVLGIEEEFISAPRLDNLTSVQALVTGILEGERTKGINMMVVFDHEEVGSKTKQGAGSTLMPLLLEKCYQSLGMSSQDYKNAIMDSLLMSVDVSHGFHPSYEAKNDPTNKSVLNQGFCIKEACSQSYATDSEGIAIVQQICRKQEIPYQKFVNRSDGTGGGTLGAIASAMLPVRTVDIGVPLLAMHSSRELMGIKDQTSLTKFIKSYFSL
ncbi:MAG: M18 family aminopeptidase [Lachnospiraceae bacterium]